MTAMTAQIISFENLDRDVKRFAQSLLSSNDSILSCLIVREYPRHPIVLTELAILKFVLHQIPVIIAAEVIPLAKVETILIEEYSNKATTTAYHRDVVIVDSKGNRFVEAITSQGVKPIMRPREPFSKSDPRNDHDLIGSFALPEEKYVFQEWASNLESHPTVRVERRRGSRW